MQKINTHVNENHGAIVFNFMYCGITRFRGYNLHLLAPWKLYFCASVQPRQRYLQTDQGRGPERIVVSSL